jgi:hypothetical protein
VYYRKAAFSCAFLWAKELNTKDIHKEFVSCLRWEVLGSGSQLVREIL